MGNETECDQVVIPIEKGRIIKTRRRAVSEIAREQELPAVRRLRQLVEMLAELTSEVAGVQ